MNTIDCQSFASSYLIHTKEVLIRRRSRTLHGKNSSFTWRKSRRRSAL